MQELKGEKLQDKHAVPDDFPHPAGASGLGGAQEKYSVVEFDGKFYLPGGAPPERLAAWQECEAHVQKLVELCTKNIVVKYAHLRPVELLELYCQRMLDADTEFSAAEDRWKIRRVADLLDWPVPENAKLR